MSTANFTVNLSNSLKQWSFFDHCLFAIDNHPYSLGFPPILTCFQVLQHSQAILPILGFLKGRSEVS
ncbi:hypothetical protein L6452_15948 [Arctium lappa]|uniref:Uncharacterized protein n=1 Tax=Arctium lappa TaxID=4217 RepID=A0ACB9CQ05_ARCLA|nr:hypothetical protein L6452_15948 [Arctium lappa]